MAAADIVIVVCLPVIAIACLAYLWECTEPLRIRYKRRGYWPALIKVLRAGQ